MSDPVEEQAVRLWRIVYGNVQQSLEDAQLAFRQQEPVIVEGWLKLARRVFAVTTPETLGI